MDAEGSSNKIAATAGQGVPVEGEREDEVGQAEREIEAVLPDELRTRIELGDCWLERGQRGVVGDLRSLPTTTHPDRKSVV